VCDDEDYCWDDAFVTRLNATGSDVIYSTFLGGWDDDWGRSVAVDAAGNATVTGDTWSDDFPTTPGAFDTSFNDYLNVFVTRFELGEQAYTVGFRQLLPFVHK
jgi:hypothetical protein